MPQNVPIQAVPSQTFSCTLDNNLFDLAIRYTNGVMAFSATINGVDTIDNIRMMAGSFLIPSQYQESGNFLLLTSNYQLPIYTQFNVSQVLYYFTAAELAAYRVPVKYPITVADFNPLGGLPLRFSPAGYTAV